jgi:hypothetical protein
MSMETEDPINPLWELRNKLFEMNPAQLGLSSSPEFPRVWGLLMETGYEEGPVSLLVILDQTTSLYLPTGGGVIGAGAHQTVWAASKAFLETGEAVFDAFTITSDRELPGQGELKFHLLTYEGALMAGGDEEEIGNGNGSLSALFWAGQAVISQIRLVSPSNQRA